MNPLRFLLRLVPCLLIALIGFAGAAASSGVENVVLPLTPYRFPGAWLLTASWALVVASAGLLFAPPKARIAAMILTLGLASVMAFGFREPKVGDRMIVDAPATPNESSDEARLPKVWLGDGAWWEDPLRKDDLYGYRAIPLAQVRHFHRDFPGEVVYTFDEQGWRAQPKPSVSPDQIEPRPIVFAGCSFTFGYGVRDDETFTSILATEAWPRYHVLNRSMTGYGAPNVCRIVEEEEKRDPRPLLMVYSLIDHHRVRGYLRKRWHDGMSHPFPLYDFEGDKLQYLGLRDAKFGDLPDSERLDEKENRIMVALVERMARICRDAGTPFVVLCFDTLAPAVRDPIGRIEGARVLDLPTPDTDRHPHEGHPTAAWHRIVADLIASDPLFAQLAHSPDLYRPGSISSPPQRWTLALNHQSSAAAALSFPSPGLVRVDEIRVTPRRHDTMLCRSDFPLRAGRPMRISFRLRADRKRKITIEVKQAHQPLKYIAGLHDVSIGPTWSDHVIALTPEYDESRAQVLFVFGDSDAPFEVDQFAIELALAPGEPTKG